MRVLSYFFLLFLFTISGWAANVEERCPVVVLGGGVAGLTSATFLARSGITPIVITGAVIGGAIAQSHNVENWPGEISISGVELSEKMRSQAEAFGADLRAEELVSVDFSVRPYLITTRAILSGENQLKQYRTDSCIIALGSTAKRLGVQGESNYWSEGVYTCAVCDGALYRGKVVAVVGGGDAALIEAQYLANIAAKVHLFVRGKGFRSVEKMRMQEILSNSKIEVHYESIVSEIQGDGDKVTHLMISRAGLLSHIPVDALFLAIGSTPNSHPFAGQLALEPNGCIHLVKDQETSKPGIYAVGDITDSKYQQAVTAAGAAAKAAIQSQQFIGSLIAQEGKKEREKSNAHTTLEVLSSKQWEEELRSAKGVVIADFYSTHCGPCRTFAPIYEAWAKKYGDKCTFLKVNADKVPELFQKYRVRGVPTILLFDEKGQVVRTMVGLGETAAIERHLQGLKNPKIDEKLY